MIPSLREEQNHVQSTTTQAERQVVPENPIQHAEREQVRVAPEQAGGKAGPKNQTQQVRATEDQAERKVVPENPLLRLEPDSIQLQAPHQAERQVVPENPFLHLELESTQLLWT